MSSKYEKYGITDMTGLEQPLDYDGDGELKGPELGPMRDGNYTLSLRPRLDEEGNFIKVKTGKRGPFVLASVQIRYYNTETGKEGGYVGTNFLNTIKWDNQTTSDLVFLCKIAGMPAPNNLTPVQLAEHIEKVIGPYAETEGSGLLFLGRTVWELSHKAVDEGGNEILNDNGKATYLSIKGMDKVQEELRTRAEADASTLIAEGQMTESSRSGFVEDQVRLGKYFDPITGEPRSVRTTLTRIIGSVS